MMDKRVKQLSCEQIRYVYRHFMKKDFPDKERKPLANIEKAVTNQKYDCFGLFDEEEICGYAFLVICKNKNGKADYLLDYFAVKKELRNQGFGSFFLELLKEYFPDADSMLVETENPDFATNQADRILRMRRLQFYLRNGLRDTGVTARIFGVEYRILEHVSAESHTIEQIKEIYSKLYHFMLPEWIYASSVVIH